MIVEIVVLSSGTGYAGHASQLAPTLVELAKLEKEAQDVFLLQFYGPHHKVKA